MEAKYCSTLIKTDNQGALTAKVQEKAFEVKSPSFPFGIGIDKSLTIEDTHHDFSNCTSPKSILDANSLFSESTSSSSEGLDASESSNLSEEDMSHFRKLLSFALESPPSKDNSVSKSSNSSNLNRSAMFPSFSMKSQPSGNIYNCINPFIDRAIAVPPYPAMSSLNKYPVKRPPPTRIQASHKCSAQSPQYPCPCLLFSAMEKHLGYNKINNFPTAKKPKISTKPPFFPNLPQPSSTAARPLHSYNRNAPFYNVGSLPILNPMHYRPPLPVNPGSAPLPLNIPFNQCTNRGMHSSQQLHYNFRDGKENSVDSIELFESELHELLRGRRKPIRISVLPAMYEEKFRKPFNKSNEKLTALLSKCTNIVLVYRQGGQHVIMLKHHESVPAVSVSRRTNKALDPRSRKVYLTFPPGSTFTSDDAETYFRQFGPVRGVRMSHEVVPTYAFVEFYSSEGALSTLCSTRAHYINGQKVMVKPYRQSFAYKL